VGIVIVPGLEVVELGLGVQHIAAVAQGIDGGEDVALLGVVLDGVGFAVAGVEVTDNQLAGGIRQAGYIPLNIGDVIVSGAGGGTIGRIGQGQGRTGSVIGNVYGLGTACGYDSHPGQLITGVDIIVCGCSVGPGSAHTVGIVGIGPGNAARGQGIQLSAMLPGKGPGAVSEHIAHRVIGDIGNGTVFLDTSQQIPPAVLPVLVFIRCNSSTGGAVGDGMGLDITGVVIGPGMVPVHPAVALANQLVGCIVGIGDLIAAIGDFGDVAVVVIFVVVSNIGIVGIIYRMGLNLIGRSGCGQIEIVGIRFDGAASMLGGLGSWPTKGIVGIVFGGGAVGDRGDPVIVIVGVGCGLFLAVDGLHHGGQHILLVVFVPDTMAVTCP